MSPVNRNYTVEVSAASARPSRPAVTVWGRAAVMHACDTDPSQAMPWLGVGQACRLGDYWVTRNPDRGRPLPARAPDLEGFVAFLYVLMRDEVPTGVVERVVRDHVEATAGTARAYTSPQLESLARDLARRIAALDAESSAGVQSEGP